LIPVERAFCVAWKIVAESAENEASAGGFPSSSEVMLILIDLWRGEAALFSSSRFFGAEKIPILKWSAQFLAKSYCKAPSDEPR
jgi:hypothetical protein